MKANPLTLILAISIAFGGLVAKADENMPAILKKVSAKHQVVKLEEKQMSEVRGDFLTLPTLNLLGAPLTITLLQPNTLVWGMSGGVNPFQLQQLDLVNGPNLSTGSLNVAGLFYVGGGNGGGLPSTLYFGILHNGQLLYTNDYTPF